MRKITVAVGSLAITVGALLAVGTPALAHSTTCTYTQGYYKNHPAVLASRVGNMSSLTDEVAASLTSHFGMSLIDILKTPPAKGNAELIAAHQFIAAAATGQDNENDTFNNAELDNAFNKIRGYFLGYWTLTDAQLKTYAAVLDRFNNGLITFPHCG